MKADRAYRLISLCTTCILGLSILLLAACITITLKNRSDPDAANLLGIKPIYVSSDAMEPAIRQSSIVFSRKAMLDEMNEGDIVLRIYNDRMVIRRIVKKTSGGDILTKADNRLFEDSTALDDSNFIAVILSG